MLSKKFFLLSFLVVSVTAPKVSVGATIQEFLPDLTQFNFDVTDLDILLESGGVGIGGQASGLSNGIGWSLAPTAIFETFTVTDGSYQFFGLPLGTTTDTLHLSIDFTITFDVPIDKLLVALSNDNLTDTINFGIVPTDFFGVTTDSFGQLTLNNPLGGLALFENIKSLTITHTNNNSIDDGFDLAFHASALPVPENTSKFSTLFTAITLCGFGSLLKRIIK